MATMVAIANIHRQPRGDYIIAVEILRPEQLVAMLADTLRFL